MWNNWPNKDWLNLLQRKLTTVNQLSWEEKWWLGVALVSLPIVACLVRSQGLKFTQRLLGIVAQRYHFSGRERKVSAIILIAQMVKIAARYYRPWVNCLSESLVLWALLRWVGMESDLKIGVRRLEGKFEAHAWVEWEGIPLSDRGDSFVPFDLQNPP